jgi:hypothetical protein
MTKIKTASRNDLNYDTTMVEVAASHQTFSPSRVISSLDVDQAHEP